MRRLVETDFASAGKPDLGDRTPPCFFHLGTADALLSERCRLSPQIVTHEIELVPNIRFGWMDGRLRRRQREDQPIVAGIDRGKSQDIPEEGTISRRISAVDDDVGTKDHRPLPSAFETFRRPGPLRS